jgi:hypothetical protein
MEDKNDIIFTKEECDLIIKESKTSVEFGIKIPIPKKDHEFDWFFIRPNDKTQWIFDKLYKYIETELGVKVTKQIERIMLNHYKVNGRFFAHQDEYHKNEVFTLVINLNENYEGGEFKLYNPEFTLNKKTGNAVLIDNKRVHEVLRVTSGERWSIVAFFLRKDLIQNKKLL